MKEKMKEKMRKPTKVYLSYSIYGEKEQRIYRFSNGYGASVIRGPFTYGGPDGLWELAVLYGEDICYSTVITQDVIGFLSEARVNEILDQIEELPPRPEGEGEGEGGEGEGGEFNAS